MDWFSRAFLKSSLVWLGLGMSMGALMTSVPTLTVYRTAHLHMNLLGFVAMMIYGVAYHVIPRFMGHPLHSARLAGWHVWAANAGLAFLALGFFLMPTIGPAAVPIEGIGGTLSAVGAYLFIYNIWRTLNGRAVLRRVHVAPNALPVVGAE